MSTYKEIKGFKVQTLASDTAASVAATGSWSSAGSLNTNRAYSGASGTAPSGVIFGGYTGSTYVANTETYNGTAFTEVNDLNTARGALGYAGATQSNALAISGVNPYRTNVEKWDGSSWTETGDVAVARNAGSGAGTSTAAIYFGGNHPPSSTKVDSNESFNGSTWTEVNNLNTAKAQMAGSGTSTAAFAIGGYSTANLATVEQWNGTSWTETTDINTARRSLGGSSGAGTVTATLIFGGYASPAQVANTESWDGSAWTEVADMAAARSDFAGTGTTTSALASGGEPNYGATEQWSTTPAADFTKQNLGQVYYNSTSNAFKVTAQPVPGGTWASVSSMNTARGRLGGFGSATAAIGAGGVLPPNGVTDAVEQWNGSAWTEIAEINTSRYTAHFQFGTTTNGIMAGGSLSGPGTPTQAVVEQWNGSAWTEVGDLNKNKSNGGATGTTTAGVIFGGFTLPGGPPTYAILAETETWNGSAWTEVNDLNNQRYTNAASIGGTSTATITFGRANQSPDSIVESWDGTNWTEVGDLNEGRESPGGAGTQTAAMAFGGTPNAALNEIWNGSSWTEANDLSTGRSQMGNAGTTNTSALAFGGANPGYTTAAEEFTVPEANSTITVS